MTNPLYDALLGVHSDKDTPFLRLLGGQTITHKQFLGRAAQFAHALTACGVKAGDRIAVCVPKSPEALMLYAACVQAGLVFLPLNTSYTSNELSYFIEDSGAALLICEDARRTALASVADHLGVGVETLNADGDGTICEMAASEPVAFETVPRTSNDLAALLYTSGTTGRSKGAMLTQKNLLSNAQTLAQEWHFTSEDVLVHALPIFHTHGLFVATNVMLACGGSIVFMPRFDTATITAWLPSATVMMGVPTFYTRLLADPDFTREVCANMRLFVSGSAPLLAETHIAFEAQTGHQILERYGMTETNMNTSNPYLGERRPGTVGVPLPGVELRVTDGDTEAALAQGEIGQIEVRGPNVFLGYWQMPEKTKAELRDDGFFITGDLGRIDDKGYIQIIGRNKDLIISGGYNIYPKEIELVLDDQTGVLESAVIGVPHADFGETVLGVLVAQTDNPPDLEGIMASIREALARFKHPRKLVMVKELPRNAMGKVQKNVLREEFKDVFAVS
ncbi:malonate--CoA ligase [Roseobacteraceae bacterium S113]